MVPLFLFLTCARSFSRRARSEQNLKKANDEILSLKEQLDKTSVQITALKKDKIDAQNEKLQATKRARLSATKLKDLTVQCNRKENPNTVEELEKRVNVLNKTVSGLASTNSKLRGELASIKLKNKDDDTADARNSSSRERPSTSTSLRAKSLETQVKSLQNSLKIEKKHEDAAKVIAQFLQKHPDLALRIPTMEERMRETGLSDTLANVRKQALTQQMMANPAQKPTFWPRPDGQSGGAQRFNSGSEVAKTSKIIPIRYKREGMCYKGLHNIFSAQIHVIQLQIHMDDLRSGHFSDLPIISQRQKFQLPLNAI